MKLPTLLRRFAVLLSLAVAVTAPAQTLTTTQAVAKTTVTAGETAEAFTPVTATGGTEPRAFAVHPALPAGLAFSPSTGEVTGTAEMSHFTPVFAGHDEFNPGGISRWTYQFQLGEVGNGFLAFQNGRMEFVKLAGPGNFFRGWDGDPGDDATELSSASAEQSWIAEITVSHAFTSEAGEFANFGLQVTDEFGQYAAIMLGNGGGTVRLRGEGTGSTATDVPAAGGNNVRLRLRWDAGSRILSAEYSYDGATYAQLRTFDPTTEWGGVPDGGFYFELFGNTNAAAEIPGGAIVADNFRLMTAAAPTTYTVTVTDSADPVANATNTFELTVNPPALTATQVVPAIVLPAEVASDDLTPVSSDGGVPLRTHRLSPQLPPGLTYDPVLGRLSGTPASFAFVPFFVGGDHFEETDEDWGYFFRTLGSGAQNGMLNMANGRLAFTKAAGEGSYYLGWDGDPTSPAYRANTSFATSWVADLTVSNTAVTAEDEFATVGLEVAGSAGQWSSVMLVRRGGVAYVRGGGAGTEPVDVAVGANTIARLRLVWNAAAQTLAGAYSLDDGETYTPIAVGSPATDWAAGAANPGFFFEVFGESNAANPIGPGTVQADDFRIEATSNATTIHTVTVIDLTGASASESFKLTIAPPPPAVISDVTPANTIPGSTVVITGSHLSTATAVTFGGVNAEFTYDFDTQTLRAVVPTGARSGNVVVTNRSGVSTGFAYAVALNIASQPSHTVVTPGQPATIAVIVNGGQPGTYTYQWRRDGVAIEGATFPIFYFPAASNGDVANYDVVVSDGTTSLTSGLAAFRLAQSAPWVWRNRSPSGNDLAAVAYGNGRYVAVGWAGTILSSTDGTTWVPQPQRPPAGLWSIAHNGSQFVIVGSSGIVLRSADGLNWTTGTVGAPVNLLDIAFGHGKWVASGQTGAIFTSTDAIAWTRQNTGIGNSINAVAPKADGFLAVSSGGHLLASNAEAVTWTPVVQAAEDDHEVELYDVKYHNGAYVVAGSEQIYVSTDGTTWNAATLPTADPGIDWNEIVANGDGFTIAGASYIDTSATPKGYVIRSTDGVNWTLAGVPVSPGFEGLAQGPAGYVAVGLLGQITHSAAGASWSTVSGGFAIPGDLNAAASGPAGTLVAGSLGHLYRSTNHVDGWTKIDVGTTHTLNAATYANGHYAVAGGNHDFQAGASVVLSSPTGAPGTWAKVDFPGVPFLSAIAFEGNAGRFVAAGAGPNIFSATVLADAWTPAPKPAGFEGTAIRAAAAGGGSYVLVGDNGTILRSTDGQNWAPANSGTTVQLTAIAYGGGRFVAAGSNTSPGALRSVFLVSTDGGVTWTKPAVPYTGSIRAIAFANGIFRTVGGTMTTLRSTDGVNWMADTSQYSNLFRALVRTPQGFVAAGTGGAIATLEAPTPTVQVAHQNVTAGVPITPFTPVTATGGLPPYNFVINPALAPGLVLNPATGEISGTPGLPGATPPFVGEEDFDSGTDAKWAYYFHTEEGENGALGFTNQRLDFTKDAGPGSYVLGWDGDPTSETVHRTTASLATSWVAELTVTNTAASADEFYNIGFNAGGLGQYSSILLHSGNNTLAIMADENREMNPVVASAEGHTTVRLRLAWDAATKELRSGYSFDGETFTLLRTFNPLTTWQTGSASSGFYFEIFANSNAAAAISAGAMHADDFSLQATSPAATLHTVTVFDALGVASTRQFTLAVNFADTHVAGFTPASAVAGTTVTINGSGFTGVSAVTFGGVNAESFTVVSDTQITAVVPANALSGSIALTNAQGVTVTIPGTFTLLVAPAIVDAPFAVRAVDGGTAVFRVAASGSQPLSFQWLENGETIPGANGPELRLTRVTAADAGNYSVRVTNPVNTITSAPAALSVVPAAPVLWQQFTEWSGEHSPARTVHDGAGKVYTPWSVQDRNPDMAAGRFIGALARFNEADGTLDTTFKLPARYRRATHVAFQGANLIIGVSAGDANTVIRTDASGAIDESFQAPLFARGIRFVTMQGDKILVAATDGADFAPMTAIGFEAPTLFRLNADGSLDDTFTPAVLNPEGNLFGEPAVDGSGRIYLAGGFATVNGAARVNLARLAADGALDTSYADPATLPAGFGQVPAGHGLTQARGVALQSDGRAVFVGDFLFAARGTSENRIMAIRLSDSGTLDTGFAMPLRADLGIAPFRRLRYLVVNGDDTIVAVSDRLVRLTANGAKDATFASRAFEHESYWLSKGANGKFFVADQRGVSGQIVMHSLVGNGIAVISADGTPDHAFQTGGWGRIAYPTDGAVLSDGRVWVAGDFNRYGGLHRPGLAQFGADGQITGVEVASTRSMSFATLARGPSDTVYAMATVASSSGETVAPSLVRILHSGFPDLNFTPVLPQDYLLDTAALHAAPAGRLLLAQAYVSAHAALQGETGDALLRLNVDGSVDATYAPASAAFASVERDGNNRVTMIRTGGLNVTHVLADGRVLLTAATADGVLSLVRLSPTGAVDENFNPPSFGNVDPAFGFTNIITDPVTNETAQFNWSTYSAADLVRAAILVPGGKVYVGGRFHLDGAPHGLVRLNFDGSFDATFTGEGIGLEAADSAPYVSALAVDAAGRVYVAGRFDRFNGTPVPGVFRLRADGTFDAGWNPGFEVLDAPRADVRLVPMGEKLYAFGTVGLPGDPVPVGYEIADIAAPAVITTQPVGVTVLVGQPITLNVVAGGSSALTYQWFKDENALSGQTAATLSIPAAALADAGAYTVVITNSAGDLTSQPATVVVRQPPVITAQPANQTIVAGQNATFSVTATAFPAPTYQWRRNGLNIPGATGSSVALTNVPANGGGNISVVITNVAGTIISEPAVLTVNPIAPVITSPATATGVRGRSFVYQITASTTHATYGAAGLPTGLVLNAATGTISGVPQSAGTFNVDVSATNASGSDDATVVITINPPPPIINSAASANGQQGVAFNFAIQAVNTPTTFAVDDLPAGLTLDADSGVISGTPTEHGVFEITLSATNAGGTSTSLFVLTIAPPLNAPAYNGPTRLSGVQGGTLSFTPPFSLVPTEFAAVGLPAWLAIDPATGVISGQLTTTGTWTFSVAATNAGGTTTVELTLTVNPAPSAPVINSASKVAAVVGTPFNFTLSATGTPTSFAATGLPGSLSLASNTGVISGTPTAPGTFNAQVRATNSIGTGPQSVLVIAIAPAANAPIITSAPVARGRVGEAFDFALTASNTPTSFTRTSGVLPPGLAFNGATGAITGTPSQVGEYRAWFAATNATGQGLALEVLFAIAPANTTPVVNSNGTAAGQVGLPFSYRITATNNPVSFSFASGVLPGGLSLDPATGIIAGVPLQPTSTAAVVMLTATNGGGETSVPKSLAITIAPAPATPLITSPLVAAGRVDTAFTYQITASDNATSFAAQNLPPGLSLAAATGVISGTPTQAGTFHVTLRAANAAGLGAPSRLALSFAAAASAPAITSPAAASGKVGAATAFSYQITATPGPITSYGLTGTLPLGLALNTSTGLLSGQPVESGIFTVQLTATNAGGSSLPQPLVLFIAPADNVPVITSPLYAVATVGTAFTYQISAASTPAFPAAPFPAPYLLEAVDLPAGLAVNPATGLIQGVPDEAGVFTATLVGTNQAGTGPFRDLILFIQPAPTAPTVTSSPTVAGQVGVAFGYQITATNNPESFEVLGAPAWMTMNAESGNLAGTPTAPGIHTVQLLARNAAGTSRLQSLTIAVAPAPNTPVITSSRLAAGQVGAAFAYQITASNSPTAFIATGLPAGLNLDSATGAITGTPMASGQFEVSFSGTNANGAGQPATLILTIQPSVTLVVSGS